MSIAYFPFSDEVVNIIATGNFQVIYACKLDFKNGMVRAHTSTGNLVIDGETYTGVGQFGEVSQLEETADSRSPMSVTLTLNGLDPDVLQGTLVDKCCKREGVLYFVVIDSEGNMAYDICFKGQMDAPQFNFASGSDDNSISVTITDKMVTWNRKGTKRFNDENHRARHDDDRFFCYIDQMQTAQFYFGYAKDRSPFKYS